MKRMLAIGVVGLALLIVGLSHMTDGTPVKAAGEIRFEPISESTTDLGHSEYTFDVFHDNVTGKEIVCVHNDVHYTPSCMPTGRSW